MTEPEIGSAVHGDWTQLHIVADGRKVSRVSFGPFVFAVGRHAAVRMAGIGGVSTEEGFRRRGFAHRLLARAMEQIESAGYSCSGLYTGTDIVAHRLYRRVGFVDVVVHQPAVKLLEPTAYTQRRLGRALAAACAHTPGLATWRCDLSVRLADQSSIHLRIEAGGVHVLDQPPGRSDLTLTLSNADLLRLCEGTVTPLFAQTSGLLRWRGDAEHWRRLTMVLASQSAVINEGSL